MAYVKFRAVSRVYTFKFDDPKLFKLDLSGAITQLLYVFKVAIGSFDNYTLALYWLGRCQYNETG